MRVPAILFPSDPLNARRPDPHFAWEARLLRELGGDHALVDHDALQAGDMGEAVRRVPEGRGPLWYRGWMIPSASYSAFAEVLARRGGTLLTSPAGYASAHELPGWYPVFEGATPPSVWLPGAPADRAELAAAAGRLGGRGPAIVKDYVKSRKHEWAEACFVPDLADLPALERVVARFIELQGEFLSGGVVLRRYEDFARADLGPLGGESGSVQPDSGAQRDSTAQGGNAGAGEGQAGEARVWWLDGEPVLSGPHPDTPGHCPEPDLTAVRPLVRALGCRFVTTDLALRTDGSGWRVVEVGDGQVSDLPHGIDAAPLLTSLIAA